MTGNELPRLIYRGTPFLAPRRLESQSAGWSSYGCASRYFNLGHRPPVRWSGGAEITKWDATTTGVKADRVTRKVCRIGKRVWVRIREYE